MIYVLVGFGIILKIREKKVRGKIYYYVIILGLENLERFLSEIGFFYREKLERILKFVKKFNLNFDSLNVNYEFIFYVRDRFKLNFFDDKRSWSYRKVRKILWELMKEIYYCFDEFERLKEFFLRSIFIDWNEMVEWRKEIVEKMGIRVDRFFEYIKGKRKLSLRNYIKIVKVFGIDFEFMINVMRVFVRKYLSYVEIGRKFGIWNFSVRIIFESNMEKIKEFEEIRKIEFELIGEIFFDEKFKEGVVYLIFFF